MADRFYGYQYGTNARKLNSEYAPYRNRYPKKEESVTSTTNKNHNKNRVKANSKNRVTNRVQTERREKNAPEYQRKKVSNNSNRVHNRTDINKQNNVKNETINNVHNVKITKAQFMAKLKIVISLIAGFSVLFAISYQNSLINESFNRKEQYKKDLEALSKTNQQIEVSIENSLNLNNIEQVAREKLGMQKLSNEQKIYISLPKEDYVAPAAEQIVMEEDVGLFEKIVRWFSK